MNCGWFVCGCKRHSVSCQVANQFRPCIDNFRPACRPCAPIGNWPPVVGPKLPDNPPGEYHSGPLLLLRPCRAMQESTCVSTKRCSRVRVNRCIARPIPARCRSHAPRRLQHSLQPCLRGATQQAVLCAGPRICACGPKPMPLHGAADWRGCGALTQGWSRWGSLLFRGWLGLDLGIAKHGPCSAQDDVATPFRGVPQTMPLTSSRYLTLFILRAAQISEFEDETQETLSVASAKCSAAPSVL